MSVEEEMKTEIKRIENELSVLDIELEKLHKRIVQILMVRKKKERDLKVLKNNFTDEKDDKEFQTTLSKLLGEMY